MVAEPSYRLRKSAHLRSPADFRRVYERRLSAADDVLFVYACENELAFSRFGVSVSRKVGKAVFRNRLRRLYREAFRLTRPELPVGLDFVLLPRASKAPSLAQLKQSLIKLGESLARRAKGST